jgi:hypothetical protein
MSSMRRAASIATTTAVRYGEIPQSRTALMNSPTATPAKAVWANASPMSASCRWTRNVPISGAITPMHSPTRIARCMNW